MFQQLPPGFVLDEPQKTDILPPGFILDEPKKEELPPGFVLDTPEAPTQPIVEPPSQQPQPLSKEKIMQVTPDELKEGMMEKMWVPYPGGPPLHRPKPKKIVKNLLTGALDFWKGLGEMGEKTKFLLPGAIPRPEEEETIAGRTLGGVKAVGEMGVGMAKWMGEVAVGLALNPIKFTNERPFDVALALTGFKSGKAIVEKGVTKGKLLGKQIQKAIKKAPDEIIAPELKRSIVEKVPPEMEFDFSEVKAEGIPKISPTEPMGIRGEIPSKADLTAPKEPISDVFHVKKEGTMPILREEIAPILKAKDISATWGERFLQNPIRIFEDYPILKEKLYNVARDADIRIHTRRKEFVRQTKSWSKELKDSGLNPKASEKRIGTYLTSLDKIGREKLNLMGIKDPPSLSIIEKQMASRWRVIAEDFFKEINAAREMAGQKPIKYQENYYTYITNLELLEEAGLSLILDKPNAIQSYLDGIPLKYATPRKGSPLPINLNAFDVFNKYAYDVIGAVEMTPAIAKTKAFIEAIDVAGAKLPRLKKFLSEWSNIVANRRPTSKILQSEGGRRVEGIAKKLNKNISMAILSYNVRSALIQPAAWRNTFTEIGPKYFLQGVIDNFNPTKRAFANKHIGNRNMDIHAHKMVDRNIRGQVGGVKGKAAEAGLKYGLQVLDMETARSTWFGAHRKATQALKLKGKQATNYATDVVVKTQASGARIDIAPIQSTPMGRLATLFQTFVINDWNFLVKDVLGIRNPKATPVGTGVKIFKYVAATALLNAVFEDVFNIRSPFPAPEKAIKHGREMGKGTRDIMGDVMAELAEQLPIIGGSIRWAKPYGGVPMPASPQTINDLIGVFNKVFIRVSPDKLSKRDIETLGKTVGIPGTSQVMKYIRRRQKGMGHAESIIGARTDVPTGTKKEMINKQIDKLRSDFRAGKVKNPGYQRKLDKLLAKRAAIRE